MWRFLHIVSMFGALSVGIGAVLVRNAVVRSGDVPAMRRALAVERRLTNRVSLPLFLAGIAFGFVAAVTIGFDLTAPWLVTAYLLVVATFVNAFVLDEPHVRKLQAALAASKDDRPSAELAALTRSKRTRFASVVDAFLWFAIIYTMVMKPFS
jgi:hypothetical protein